jgi:hypothetical protein
MPGYTPGAAGYTPGSAHDPDGVLQPLDDVNMFQDDVNVDQDDVPLEAWVGQVAGDEKENAPGSGAGTSGKGVVAAANGAGAGRMVWPADAETLIEQEAAGEAAVGVVGWLKVTVGVVLQLPRCGLCLYCVHN